MENSPNTTWDASVPSTATNKRTRTSSLDSDSNWSIWGSASEYSFPAHSRRRLSEDGLAFRLMGNKQSRDMSEDEDETLEQAVKMPEKVQDKRSKRGVGKGHKLKKAKKGKPGSSGVGSKVDLKFNPETLRIEDLDEDEDTYDTINTITMTDAMKRSSVIRSDEDATEDNVDIVQQGLALRNLLKKK